MKENFNADTIDIEEEFRKLNEKIKKPNILICGATGVGKSSFINEVFNSEVAKVGEGVPVTKGIEKYERDDLEVVLYDSEGYEVGALKQDYFKEEILGIIDKNRDIEDIDKQIHEVWYFISAANKRVTSTDIEVINLIKEKSIPICVVITQIDNVDMEELKGVNNAIKKHFKDIDIFNTCTTYDREVLEAIKEFNEKEKVIDWAIENLEESMKDAFIISMNKDLDRVKKYVSKKIIPMYITGAIGASLTPIPFSDAAVLTPLQITMSCHIIKIYGIENKDGQVTSVLETSIVSQIGKFLSKTLLGSLLKFIPGAGDALGAVINGSVAASLTMAIGYSISKMCYKYSKDVIDLKEPDLLIAFAPEKMGEMIRMFYKNKEQKFE